MPVTRTRSLSVKFGASHVLDGHPTCGRMHGHSYLVTFTFHGDPVAGGWGSPVTLVEEQAVANIAYELANRHLNDMLPASPPSVSGVSAYLLERTQILKVTKVEVHESDTNVTGIAEYVDR